MNIDRKPYTFQLSEVGPFNSQTTPEEAEAKADELRGSGYYLSVDLQPTVDSEGRPVGGFSVTVVDNPKAPTLADEVQRSLGGDIPNLTAAVDFLKRRH